MDAMPVISYRVNEPGGTSVVAADDWQCLDGLPIRRVKWWGGYPGHGSQDPSLLPPPEESAARFILSWYSPSAGSPDAPGVLIAQETVAVFQEVVAGTATVEIAPQTYQYEHIYQYEHWLQTPWPQQKDSQYFLVIQAVFDSPEHSYDWGWIPSEVNYLRPAVQLWDENDGWNELSWPQTHRLGYGPKGLAFELYTDEPTPTPTPSVSPTLPPTETPTISPTPSVSPAPTPLFQRWLARPNISDGISRFSWKQSGAKQPLTSRDRLDAQPEVNPVIVADDWMAGDDRPLNRITWWGAFQQLVFGGRYSQGTARRPTHSIRDHLVSFCRWSSRTARRGGNHPHPDRDETRLVWRRGTLEYARLLYARV